MRTTHFVNDWNKNVSLMLIKQQVINKKLEAKLDALEDVVIELGQEIENIKVQLSTKCHANFRYVCVTPLAYDKHHNWNLTKNHLLGV